MGLFYSFQSDKNPVSIDKFVKGKKSILIPQLWWGNIKNPKIIILSKNPHYGISDEFENQNEKIREILLNKE